MLAPRLAWLGSPSADTPGGHTWVRKAPQHTETSGRLTSELDELEQVLDTLGPKIMEVDPGWGDRKPL